MRKLLLSVFALAVAITAAAAPQMFDRKASIKAHAFDGQIEKSATARPFKAPAKKISTYADIPGTYVCYYASYFDDYKSTYCTVTIEQGETATDLIIKGLWGSWTKDLNATLDTENGTITIPRQSLYEYTGDDPADFVNVNDTDAAVTATVYSDGIVFDNPWGALITSGDSEGYYYVIGVGTMFLEPNAKMVDTKNNETLLYIEQSNDTVTIGNFGGIGVDIYAILMADSTFTIPSQFVDSSTNGDFYTTDISTWYFGEPQFGNFGSIDGVGTETTLTSDLDGYGWTAGATTGYWYGQMSNFMITRLDEDVFVYPVAPALYLAGSMTNWATGKEAMTLGEDGKFSITKEMEANAEFKFINENDEWIGGDAEGNFIVQKEQVENGTELTLLVNAGNNFQIPVAGTWTLTVDPETMKLVISGEWNEPAPEPVDVYILGEVNDNGWGPNVGLQMTKAEDANIYTADVTIDGRNDGYNYFSFTTKLAENADDWGGIASYRYGAETNNFEVTEALLGTDLTVQAGENAFKIAKGDYSLSLNLDELKLVVTKKAAYKEGDVNGDGKVDVADVNCAINIILEIKTPEDYVGNADLNGDGKVDVSDVNLIINIILAN
ncbi:MAG: hypothetical protein J5565_03740 [Muribaculaceae bacterium]|nr:hypothetical protein [Muribaculaceae bacterium]